jgi:hypothetical protein
VAEFQQQAKWKDVRGERYKPREQWLDSLNNLQAKGPVDARIYLGTWCSDSRKWVPRFFRLSNYLPLQKIEIIAVDTSKRDAEGMVYKDRVDSLPTFLFFRDDIEVGRFHTKPPKRNLERKLYQILR